MFKLKLSGKYMNFIQKCPNILDCTCPHQQHQTNRYHQPMEGLGKKVHRDQKKDQDNRGKLHVPGQFRPHGREQPEYSHQEMCRPCPYKVEVPFGRGHHGDKSGKIEDQRGYSEDEKQGKIQPVKSSLLSLFQYGQGEYSKEKEENYHAGGGKREGVLKRRGFKYIHYRGG